MMKKELLDRAQAVLFILGFMFSGPLLIMNNKVILNDLKFPYPLFLSFFTLVFSSVSGFISVFCFNVELKNKHLITREFYVLKVVPIGILTALTIVLGMASYLFLTVSFIQMLKAFTPVMTLFFLLIFQLDSPRIKEVYWVLAICFGTAVAGSGELHFNLTGAFLMIAAQICESLRLVFTQKVLKKSNASGQVSLKSPNNVLGADEKHSNVNDRIRFSVFESLYYITPACALCVFIATLFVEVPSLVQSRNETMATFLNNFPRFCFSGVLAVSTNLINWKVIQFTDALMLKLLATTRNALLVLFNAFFLAEIVTPTQFFGYFLSLLGFLGYNYVKMKRSDTEKREIKVLESPANNKPGSKFETNTEIQFNDGHFALQHNDHEERNPLVPTTHTTLNLDYLSNNTAKQRSKSANIV